MIPEGTTSSLHGRYLSTHPSTYSFEHSSRVLTHLSRVSTGGRQQTADVDGQCCYEAVGRSIEAPSTTVGRRRLWQLIEVV